MSIMLNLIVDGSWLFKACKPGGYLASKTANPTGRFKLDFNKLALFIQHYVSGIAGDKVEYSIKYIATSIFDTEKTEVPFKEWPQNYAGITDKMINDFISNKIARTKFINNAIRFGGFQYENTREIIKPRIISELSEDKYREKLVDSKVSAKLSSCVAKHQNDEYYAVATGDKDIMPTLQAEYPDFTQNVLLITTQPCSSGGIASFELVDFVNRNFRLKPLMLDEHIDGFLHVDGNKC